MLVPERVHANQMAIGVAYRDNPCMKEQAWQTFGGAGGWWGVAGCRLTQDNTWLIPAVCLGQDESLLRHSG